MPSLLPLPLLLLLSAASTVNTIVILSSPAAVFPSSDLASSACPAPAMACNQREREGEREVEMQHALMLNVFSVINDRRENAYICHRHNKTQMGESVNGRD